MRAHALETAQQMTTLPLDALEAHLTSGAEDDDAREEAGAVDFQKAFAAGSMGAGIGGAAGTVIPGIGNVVGGVVGGAIGAGVSIIGDLFKRKKKPKRKRTAARRAAPRNPTPAPPVTAAQKEVLEKVKAAPGNPFAAADALLLTVPTFDFAKAHKEQRLPSQVAARPSYGKVAQALEKKAGEALRRELAGFTPAEQAVIGAAVPAGLGAQARAAVLAIRARNAEAEAEAEAEPEDDVLDDVPQAEEAAEETGERDAADMANDTGKEKPVKDPGASLQALAILAFWTKRHPGEADPAAPPFGALASDLSSAKGRRARAALAAWQRWYNNEARTSVLRSDGVLDQATYAALASWCADRCAQEAGQHDAPDDDAAGTEEPSDARPMPAYHIQQTQLPPRALGLLLATVPELWRLPRRSLRTLAGTLPGGVKDAAGIDGLTGDFVARPGQTLSGIAEQLTGDGRRTRELLAANPRHAPANPRFRIPPSYGIGVVLAPPTDTGAPYDISPEPDAPAPAPSPKVTYSAPSKDGPRKPSERYFIVYKDEPPYLFAKRVGAHARPKWFSELRRANPHKLTKDNGGNFATYAAGEILNYPGEWPITDSSGKRLERVLSSSAPPPTAPGAKLPTPEAPSWKIPGFPFPEPQKAPETPEAPKQPPTANDAPKGQPEAKEAPPPLPALPFELPFPLPGFPAAPSEPAAPSAPPSQQPQGIPPPGVQPPTQGQGAPTVPPAAPAPGKAPDLTIGGFTFPSLPGFEWPGTKPATPKAPQEEPAKVATTDPGVQLRTQAILAFWTTRYPADADPTVTPPFGKAIEDLSSLESVRARATLKAWQQWHNKRAAASLVRTDGVLDQATYAAMDKWFLEESALEAKKQQQNSPTTPSAQEAPAGAAPTGTTEQPKRSAAPLALAIPAFGFLLSQLGGQ